MHVSSRALLLSLLAFSGVAWGAERRSLIINEICPVAGDGQSAWVELFNPLEQSVVLRGIALRLAADVELELDSAVPRLGSGAFMVVSFEPATVDVRTERAGPDLIVTHAPLRLARDWTRSRGELAVYRGHGPTDDRLLLDYVAWGRPGGAWSRTRERVAVWPGRAFVPLSEGFGVYSMDARLATGDSIGLHPGGEVGTPGAWSVFASQRSTKASEVSKGAENPVPRPKAFNLRSGAVVGSRSLSLAWARRAGDDGYHFELARDAAFTEKVVVTDTESSVVQLRDVRPGTYFYRVRALVGSAGSQDSIPETVVTVPTDCDLVLPTSPIERNLEEWIGEFGCAQGGDCRILSEIQFKFQRKDTPLVCLHSGCDRASPCAWDRPHPFCALLCVGDAPSAGCHELCASASYSRTCGASVHRPPQAAGNCYHGSQNCVRAAVSMLTSAYGSCLSQDRIGFRHQSWYSPAEAWPSYELGHNVGMSCDDDSEPGGDCSRVMRWALGLHSEAGPETYLFTREQPTFAKVRSWIDTGRPVMAATDDHMRVLAGYCVDSGPDTTARAWVLTYDPETGPRPETFASWAQDTVASWVAPAMAAWSSDIVRDDTPAVWTDRDSDGLMDFDEFERFSTSPDSADTDGDLVKDKDEDLQCLSYRAVESATCPAPPP